MEEKEIGDEELREKIEGQIQFFKGLIREYAEKVMMLELALRQLGVEK